MSAATVPAVESIEALDFDPDVPCEHSEHEYGHPGDEPAAWLIRAYCETCGWDKTYPICAPGLRAFWRPRGNALCNRCRTSRPWRQRVTILGPVRS